MSESTELTEAELLAEMMRLVREQDRISTLLAKKTLERLNKDIEFLKHVAPQS